MTRRRPRHGATQQQPREYYSETPRERTVPVWRAWQLSAVACATMSLAGYWTLTSTAGEARRAALVTPAGQPPQFSVLIAGRDVAYCYHHTPCRDQSSPEARQLTRTDTLMLMQVDGTSVNILSIPRDTQMVGTYQKINSAYAYGGPQEMVRRVEELTGERVDYHAVVRTDYVATIIDALGGLNVNVPARIDFDDNAAKLHLHLDPGPQRLGGKDAVAFLRMRKGVGDDYGRIDHQKAAIAQLVDRLRDPRSLAAALPAILRGMSGSVETNADPALVQQMVPYLNDFKLSFATLPTREIPGSSNLLVDRAALAALWGTGPGDGTDKANVRILDASGRGLGPRVAWALKRRGFEVSDVKEIETSGERSQVFTLDAVTGAGAVSRWLNLPTLQGLRFPVDSGEVGVYLGSDAATRYAELARLEAPLENP